MNRHPLTTTQPEVLQRFAREISTDRLASHTVEQFTRDFPEMGDDFATLAGEDRQLWGQFFHALGDRNRLVPGEKVGAFVVVRLLAAGGMGEVYEAEQVNLRRRVILKVIRASEADYATARRRFRAEQRALARMHHSNIVTVLAAGRRGDMDFFAMPFVRGATIRDIVDEVTRMIANDRSVARSIDPQAIISRLTHAKDRSDVRPWAPAMKTAGSVEKIPAPVALPTRYFRWVAETIAAIADAIEHAHTRNTLHRDVKPSNITIEAATGTPHLLDFGLATSVDRNQTTAERCGTPGHMAPEQWEGHAETRSDVWSLGVVLFELLTLCLPFRREKPPSGMPARSDALVENVPADLIAIARRAISLHADHRYQTANELAKDIRCWLGDEPTSVRPGWWYLRPVGLWARRNPAWSTVGGVLSAVVIASVMLNARVGSLQLAKAQAEARESAQIAETRSAETLQLRREILIREGQELTRGPKTAPWWAPALEKFREAALIRKGPDVRDEIAATLSRLDATLVASHPATTGTSLIFDRTGDRLLSGGFHNARLGKFRPSLSLDKGTRWTTSAVDGEGPVAFDAAGKPLQAIIDADGTAIILREAITGTVQHRYELPKGARATKISISDDGSRLAASCELAEGKSHGLSVWTTSNPKAPTTLPFRGDVIQLSPDGNMLAVAEDRTVRVWRAPFNGEPQVTITDDRAPFKALGFGKVPLADSAVPEPRSELRGWLLATGNQGGTSNVWDLQTGSRQAILRGASFEVLSVTFHPHGNLLATAGRYTVHLWDALTGEELLRLGDSNMIPALAFSPDGTRLALSHLPVFNEQPKIQIWELHDGRGIKTLRGLQGHVGPVQISNDRRWVIDMSHDFRAAIWSADTGRLKLMLEMPTGLYAEHGDVLIAPDGKSVFVVGGERADQFSLDTGKCVKSWALPKGMCNKLAINSAGKTILVRQEAGDGKKYATSEAPSDKYPRTVRVRELMPNGEAKLQLEISDVSRHVHDIQMTPDGRYLAIDGVSREKIHYLQVHLADGGKRLWRKERATQVENSAVVKFDRVGNHVSYNSRGDVEKLVWAKCDDGEVVKTVAIEDPQGESINPSWGTADMRHGAPFRLMRRGEKVPFIGFVAGPREQIASAYVDAKNSRLAWDTSLGKVYIGDLEAIRARLDKFGLGWAPLEKE